MGRSAVHGVKLLIQNTAKLVKIVINLFHTADLCGPSRVGRALKKKEKERKNKTEGK